MLTASSDRFAAQEAGRQLAAEGARVGEPGQRAPVGQPAHTLVELGLAQRARPRRRDRLAEADLVAGEGNGVHGIDDLDDAQRAPVCDQRDLQERPPSPPGHVFALGLRDGRVVDERLDVPALSGQQGRELGQAGHAVHPRRRHGTRRFVHVRNSSTSRITPRRGSHTAIDTSPTRGIACGRTPR